MEICWPRFSYSTPQFKGLGEKEIFDTAENITSQALNVDRGAVCS
jgi:hypothetical protein